MKKFLSVALILALASASTVCFAKSELIEVSTVELVEKEHYLTHEEMSVIVNNAAQAELEAMKKGNPIYSNIKKAEYTEPQQAEVKKPGTLLSFFKAKIG